MSDQFVVRRAHDPTPLAREANLALATDRAAGEAARYPGTVFEVIDAGAGQVRVRVRTGDTGRVLVQRIALTSGDAWPDPPAWLPLEAHA